MGEAVQSSADKRPFLWPEHGHQAFTGDLHPRGVGRFEHLDGPPIITASNTVSGTWQARHDGPDDPAPDSHQPRPRSDQALDE